MLILNETKVKLKKANIDQNEGNIVKVVKRAIQWNFTDLKNAP